MLRARFTALLFSLAGCALNPPPSAGGSMHSHRIGDELAKLEGYRLIWSDECESNGLPDPLRWNFETSRNKAGWYNDELRYYGARQTQNSRVENGLLIIEARKEDLAQ